MTSLGERCIFKRSLFNPKGPCQCIIGGQSLASKCQISFLAFTILLFPVFLNKISKSPWNNFETLLFSRQCFWLDSYEGYPVSYSIFLCLSVSPSYTHTHTHTHSTLTVSADSSTPHLQPRIQLRRQMIGNQLSAHITYSALKVCIIKGLQPVRECA